MIVTPTMVTEDGSSRRLIEMADVIDDDGTGVQAQVARAGKIRLVVGSTEYPAKSAYIDAADARHLAAVLNRLADESER